jgi:hypothetical protein
MIDVDKEVAKAQQAMATRKQQEEDARIDSEFPAAVRLGEFNKTGPKPEEYDLRAAYADNVDFTPDENGGVTLPNKHAKGVSVAGMDLNTGEQTDALPEDPTGYIKRGREELAKSKFNTTGGRPKDDMYALADIFRGGFHGGSKADQMKIAGWPDEMTYQASLAGAHLKVIDDEVALFDGNKFDYPSGDPAATLADISPDMVIEPVESGTMKPEDMAKDAGWQEDAAVIHEYEEGAPFDGTPGELHNYAMVNMSDSTNQIGDMIADITMISTGGMPDEVVKAYVRQWQRYDQVESFDTGVIVNTLTSVMTDWTTWAGLGGPALLAKAVTKNATRKGFRHLLMKTLATRYGKVAAVGAAGGVEGGGAMGVVNTRQQLAEIGAGTREDFNQAELFANMGIGAGMGTTMGVGVSLLGPGAVKAIRRGMKNLQEGSVHAPGTPLAQSGRVGVKKTSDPGQYAVDAGRYDYGVSLNADGSRYSRLETSVGKHLDKYGKSGSFPVHTLLADLKGGMSKGEGGFSPGELQDTGLYDWLQSKVAIAEGVEAFSGTKLRVSRVDVEDFLYVNRQHVNMEISHFRELPDAGTVGKRYYATRETLPLGPSKASLPPDMYAFDREIRKALSEDDIHTEMDLKEHSLYPEWKSKYGKSEVFSPEEALHDIATSHVAQRMFPVTKLAPRMEAMPAVDNAIADIQDYHTALLDYERYIMAVPEGTSDTLLPKKPAQPDISYAGTSRFDKAWIGSYDDDMVKNRKNALATDGDLKLAEINDRPQKEIPQFQVRDQDGNQMGEITYEAEHEAVHAAYNYANELTADLAPDQLVNNIVQLDESFAKTGIPDSHAERVFSNGDDRFTEPMTRKSYFEMRLFVPYNRHQDVHDIAQGRFDKSYDQLTKSEKVRTGKMLEMKMDRGDDYMEGAHFPAEMNRLAHMRGHEVLDKDGNKILMIIEAQSDRNSKYARKQGKAKATKAKAGPSLENWDELAFRQALQYAAEKGYTKIAWPRTVLQVAKVEGWPLRSRDDKVGVISSGGYPSIMATYSKRFPNIVKEMQKKHKSMKISRDIVEDTEGPITRKHYDDERELQGGKYDLDDDVFVLEFDPKEVLGTKKKPMPLNGFIATPAGVAAMGEDDGGE